MYVHRSRLLGHTVLDLNLGVRSLCIHLLRTFSTPLTVICIMYIVIPSLQSNNELLGVQEVVTYFIY